MLNTHEIRFVSGVGMFHVDNVIAQDCMDYLGHLFGSSAVERATPGEEVPGSFPDVATRSLLVGSVSV